MSCLSHEFMTAGYSDSEAERLSALAESYISTIGAVTPDNYSDLIDALCMFGCTSFQVNMDELTALMEGCQQ